MPQHLRDYAILQVAVSNGSKAPYIIRPEDFTFVRPDGVVLRAAAARSVVGMLNEKGSASDVIKLVTSYENSIYGNQKLKSTNGYEQRRQSVLAMGSIKLKAAAAASALAMVQTKLLPGESTDGAVFFPIEGNIFGPGHFVVRTNTDVFNFATRLECLWHHRDMRAGAPILALLALSAALHAGPRGVPIFRDFANAPAYAVCTVERVVRLGPVASSGVPTALLRTARSSSCGHSPPRSQA